MKDTNNPTLDDVLQPGRNLLAAGYCMYGSACTVETVTIIIIYALHLQIEMFLHSFLIFPIVPFCKFNKLLSILYRAT